MDEIDPVKFIGSSEHRLFENERLMEAHINHAQSNNLLISPTLWGLYFTLDNTLRIQCLTKLLEKTHEKVKNKYKAVIQDQTMLWGRTYDELGIVNVCGKVDPQFIKKFAAVKQTMILTAKRQQRESRRVMQAPDIDDPYAFIQRDPSPLKWVPRPTFKCLETDKNVFHPDFEQAMSHRRPPKRMYDSNRSSEQTQWSDKLEATLAKSKMTKISRLNQNPKEKGKLPKNTDTNTDSGEENSHNLGYIKRTGEVRIMEENPTCSKIDDGAMAKPTTKHKVTVKNTDSTMANNTENTRVIELISRKQKLAQQMEQELQDVKKLKKIRKTNKKSLDETIQKMRQELDKKKSAGHKQEPLEVPKTPKQGNEGMTKKPGKEGTTKKPDNDVLEIKKTLKDKIQQMRNDLKRKKSIEQQALGKTLDLEVTKTRVHGKEDHIETKFTKHIVLDENNALVDFDTLVHKTYANTTLGMDTRSTNTTHGFQNTMTQVSGKTKSKTKKKKLFTQTSDNDLSPNIECKGRTVSVEKIDPKTLGIGALAKKMEPLTDKPQRYTITNDSSVTKPDPKRMDINNKIETQPEPEEMEIEELSELKRFDTDTLALKSEDNTLKTKTYVGKTESKTQTMETEIKNHKYNQTKNAETEDNKKERKTQDKKKNKESTRENKVKGNANNKNHDKPREHKQNVHNKAEALRVLEEHSIKHAFDIQHIRKQDDIELDKQEKLQSGQKTQNVVNEGERVQQNISKKAEQIRKQYKTIKSGLTNDKHVKITVGPKLIQSSEDIDDDDDSPHEHESTVQDNRFDSHYKTANKSDDKGGYDRLELLELDKEPYNMEMIHKPLEELENGEFNTKQTVPDSQDETTNEEDEHFFELEFKEHFVPQKEPYNMELIHKELEELKNGEFNTKQTVPDSQDETTNEEGEHFFEYKSNEHFVPQKIVRKEDSTQKMEDSDHEVPRENVNTPTQNIKEPTNTSLERPQMDGISQIQNDTFRRDEPDSASGSFNTKTTRKPQQVPTNEEIPSHSKMNPANQIRQAILNGDTSEFSLLNEILKEHPTPSTEGSIQNESRNGSSEEEINEVDNLMKGMTHDDNNNETNSSVFQDEKKKFKENKINKIKHDLIQNENPANQIRQEIPNSDTSEFLLLNEILKEHPTPSTEGLVQNESRNGSIEEEINEVANLMKGMTHDDNNNETNSSVFQDEKKKFKENNEIKHDLIQNENHAKASRPISEDDNDNDTDISSVFENKNTKKIIKHRRISFNSQGTSTQGIQSLDDSSNKKTHREVAIQMTKERKTNRKSRDTGELQYVLEHLSVNPSNNETDDTHMEIDQMSQLTSQQKEIQTEITAQTMKNILKSTVMDMDIFEMRTPTLSTNYIPLNRQDNQMKTPRNVVYQDIKGTCKSTPSTSKSSMKMKRKTNSYPPLKFKRQNVPRPQLHSNKPSPQLRSNVQKQKYSSNGKKIPNQNSKESSTLLENITKITSQLNVSKKEHSNMMKALEEISLATTARSQSFKPASNTRGILNNLSTEDENTSKEMESCKMISSKGFKSNLELSKLSKELTRTTVSGKEDLSKITGSSNRTAHVINDSDFEPNDSIPSPEASISSLDLEAELYLSQQVSSDTHATKDKPAQFNSEQFKEIQFEDSPPEANVEEDNKTKIDKLAELMSIINDVVQYPDESTQNNTELSVMQTSKLDSPWEINENKALAVKTQIAHLFNQPENSQTSSSNNSNEFLLSMMMSKEDSLLTSSDIDTRSTLRHNFDLSDDSTFDQEISHGSNRSGPQRLVTARPYPKKLRPILHTDESETSSQGHSQKLSRRQKYKANKLKRHMDKINMNSQASTSGEHFDTDKKQNIDSMSKKQHNSQSSTRNSQVGVGGIWSETKKQQNSQSSSRNSQVSVGGRWLETVDNILRDIKKK